jgi:hypothetical protein
MVIAQLRENKDAKGFKAVRIESKADKPCRLPVLTIERTSAHRSRKVRQIVRRQSSYLSSKLSCRLLDRNIVDAGFAPHHQTTFSKLPLLIAVNLAISSVKGGKGGFVSIVVVIC